MFRSLKLAAIILALTAFAQVSFAVPPVPDAVTPDGGRYYGPLVDGKRQGQGRIEWDNGASYEGGFTDGLFSGAGRYERRGEVYVGEFKQGEPAGIGAITYTDGRSYRGLFAYGLFNGKGRYESGDGVYDGDFVDNEFTGLGTYERSDGSRHEGAFAKWRPNGPGTFTDPSGTIYAGTFVDGELTGRGRAVHKGGASYEGEFKSWLPHGQGAMRLANGDVYTGTFAFGMYEGQGTLVYAKPREDGRTSDSGLWRRGRLADAGRDDDARERANVETALYRQRALLDSAVAKLAPRDPDRINLYLLAVAGDGGQEVFRREVDFVRDLFDRRFGTRGRSLVLVNSRTTVATVPMATITSLREGLAAIAGRMDKDRDILFLFLTSHGSKEHVLSLDQNGMHLPGLPAATLGNLLRESGIRWKVVVISACYSGGFIGTVKDDRTLVITASRADRRSFGCADENEFTDFGRAYFKEALASGASFQEAFRKTQVLVEEWETRDAKSAGSEGSDERSLPQMENPPAIDAWLQKWREQLSTDRPKS